MNLDPIAVIERVTRASHAGEVSFGALVMALAEAGVQSYLADYRARVTTYHLADDRAHAVALPAPDLAIAPAFDGAALKAAIRGAQQGEVKYPEFVRLSMQAGCVGYMVWIAGRHVSYFGRRGEVHVERFPD